MVGAVEAMVVAGHSVFVQWVPSHVGVEGNDRAEEGVVRDRLGRFDKLRSAGRSGLIGQELGLEEMSDFSEDNLSAGSHSSELSDSEPGDDVTDCESDTSSVSDNVSSSDSEDTTPLSKRQHPNATFSTSLDMIEEL